MSDADGDNHRNNDIWHDEGLYTPRPAQLQQPLAGNNVYMVAGGQDPYHGNVQPNHHHPQQMMYQETGGAVPRNEGYTVLPMGHGNYLKVYYNNEEPVNFNNYELFSNHSFIPQHMVKNAQEQSNQSQDNYYHAHAPVIRRDMSANDHSPNNSNNTNNISNPNSNNMFINQLVENWVPNLSGTYTPFGEPPASQQPPPSLSPPQHAQNIINHNFTLSHSVGDSFNYGSPAPTSGPSNFTNQLHNNVEEIPPINNNCVHITPNAPPSRTNGSFQHESTIKNSTETKKPRIVAEVKPMRMSYSDVLSKNVFINMQNPVSAAANGSEMPPSGGANANGASKSNSNTQHKSSKSSEKGKSGHFEKKSSGSNDEKDGGTSYKGTSKSNNNLSANGSSLANGRDTKGLGQTDADSLKDGKMSDNDSKQAKRKSGSSGVNKTIPIKLKNAPIDPLIKKRSQSQSQGTSATASTSKEDSDKDIQNNGYFYNVTKNETSQADRNSGKISYQPKKYSASKSSNTTSVSRNASTAKNDKSISYQQKRIHKSRKNTNYAMLAKLVETWIEYLLRFLGWLVSLVSDVAVLGFSMIWDRIYTGYHYTCQITVSLWKDLRSNSGRPSAYCWKLCSNFDKRFGKESKWAFWRRLSAKKKPPEPVPDYYKNGRLPQTGDEAMYSLLNCKGKDAYSILGVSSDCSQEQIRKHYKKIAVLVHPDKNKQPGAEEAFKILQRAFELIGEPENRKSYDQSVAEALNAEKAWSELNDLLRQLQSKIAEAANTIRCSSCGLRHPRKPTGRPHFAARQCNTCKIRHTAREGDIWAETTLFGFRWKYLALMEGKVHDITEWANCQKGALSHLQPNSHIVQYRIVLGGQQQQHNQQHQQQNLQQEKEKLRREQASEPSLDEFLDNLYSGQNPQKSNGSRRRTRKN